MVCEDDEPDVQIGIPAVMLPQDVGAILENDLMTKSKGMCFFFFFGAYINNWPCITITLDYFLFKKIVFLHGNTLFYSF